MNGLIRHIKWVMLLSGIITCSMIYAAIDPQAALFMTFGESISGPIAEIVVRNWGVLITMVGGLLIYGAFNTHYQVMAVLAAVISKLVFISLVLTIGSSYLSVAATALVFDSIVIVVFSLYLISLVLNPSARQKLTGFNQSKNTP